MRRKNFNPDDLLGEDIVDYPNGRYFSSEAAIRIEEALGARLRSLACDKSVVLRLTGASLALAKALDEFAGQSDPPVKRLKEVLAEQGYDLVASLRQVEIETLAYRRPATEEERMIAHLSLFGREIAFYEPSQGLCPVFARRSTRPFDSGEMEEALSVFERNGQAAVSAETLQAMLACAPLEGAEEFTQYGEWLRRLRLAMQGRHAARLADLMRGEFRKIGEISPGSGKNPKIRRGIELASSHRAQLRLLEEHWGGFSLYEGPVQMAG